MGKQSLINELQEALTIDKHELDEELIRQPTLLYKVSELYLQAKATSDDLISQVTVLWAELDEKYRKKHAEEKLKEREFKSMILTNDKMKALQEQAAEAKRRANKLEALKEAYKQRGYTLNNLTDLYAANYFSSESGGSVRSEVVERRAEEVRKETGKLRRRKFSGSSEGE